MLFSSVLVKVIKKSDNGLHSFVRCQVFGAGKKHIVSINLNYSTIKMIHKSIIIIFKCRIIIFFVHHNLYLIFQLSFWIG